MSQAMIDTEYEQDPTNLAIVPAGYPLGVALDGSSELTASTSRFYRLLGKRLLDVVVASIVLFVVTPALVLVWLILRFTLGRSVVLRQERVGFAGQSFSLIKFRTMKGCRRRSEPSCSYVGTDRRLDHKSCDDPRHTRIGRVVRRFSLDELPQLINVLRGDMSLVGPRPELASVATTEFLLHVRHEVRPGLTGPFQVSDMRGSGDLTMGLAMDEAYVTGLGLRSDVRYLAQTAGALRQGTGS